GAMSGMVHSLVPLSTSVETSVRLWALVVVLGAWGLLSGGLYKQLELMVATLVGIFSISVALGLLLVQGTQFRISASELLSGLTFSLGDHHRAAAYAIISLLGALGTTANELFMYPYWILEKGYGADLPGAPPEAWTATARRWIRNIW